MYGVPLIASGRSVRLVRKTAAGMSTPTTRICSAATAPAAVFQRATNASMASAKSAATGDNSCGVKKGRDVSRPRAKTAFHFCVVVLWIYLRKTYSSHSNLSVSLSSSSTLALTCSCLNCGSVHSATSASLASTSFCSSWSFLASSS